MLSLSLVEAARFLRIHPEELRKRVRLGRIPGAKIGRCWVFLQEDLAAYLRSLYGYPRQAMQVTTRKEELCHLANAAESGGSTSLAPQGNEYVDLLKLPTKPSRKNSTTS